MVINSVYWFIAESGSFLTSLDCEVAQTKLQAYAPGSLRNRATQIRAYALFALHANVSVLPVTVNNLCRYLVFLSRSIKSYQTLKNYLDGVKFYQTSHGYPTDVFNHHSVKLTMRALRKRLRTMPQQKLPITVDILLAMHQQMDMTNIVHIVVWAAFLVAFFGFLRKANVVPPRAQDFNANEHLSRSSFSKDHKGYIATLFKTKTNQFTERVLQIPFLPIPGSPLCPVSALNRMFQCVSAPTPSPAFVIPHRGSLLTLTHASYTRYLHHFLRLAGIDPSNYSGHSFRRGGCTFASEAGAPSHFIKTHGDWASSSFEHYLSKPIQTRKSVFRLMSTKLQRS